MKYSIQMYTLREYMKTPEALDNTLDRVAKMGYESVQITPPAFTDAKKLAAQLERKGLSADSAFCDVYQIPDRIGRIVDDATALKTNVLRTNSIRAEDSASAEGYRSFAAHLNTCGELLKREGIDFMYHFHSFEFVKLGNTRGIDILLNETDPSFVLFQPDVFWLAAAGTEPSRELEKFKGRARYMHCKDYVIAARKDGVLENIRSASAPVGTGNLRWDEIFKTAKKIGIENFVVEDDMGVLPPFESAEISLPNLKKLSEEV